MFNCKETDCHTSKSTSHPSKDIMIKLFPHSLGKPEGFPFGNLALLFNPQPHVNPKHGVFVWDATSWLQAPCVVYLLSPNVCCAAGNENCSAGTKTKRNTTFYLAKEDRSCHPVLHLHVSVMPLSHQSIIQCFDYYYTRERHWHAREQGQPTQGISIVARQKKCITFKWNSKGWGFTSSSRTTHQITKQSDHL